MEDAPPFGTPPDVLALLDCELEAYRMFADVARYAPVRRVVHSLASVPDQLTSQTTIYEPLTMPADFTAWGHNQVTVTLAQHETVPPERAVEGAFWGTEYFARPSERIVQPRMDLYCSATPEPTRCIARYRRPPVQLSYGENGQLVPDLADPSFVLGERTIVALDQEYYLKWLRYIAMKVVR